LYRNIQRPAESDTIVKADILFTVSRYLDNNVKHRSEVEKKRILVVDDEQDLTFTLKAILDETGSFQVEKVTDPILVLSEFKAKFVILNS
jgi:PleD family two-component response regulator